MVRARIVSLRVSPSRLAFCSVGLNLLFDCKYNTRRLLVAGYSLAGSKSHSPRGPLPEGEQERSALLQQGVRQEQYQKITLARQGQQQQRKVQESASARTELEDPSSKKNETKHKTNETDGGCYGPDDDESAAKEKKDAAAKKPKPMMSCLQGARMQLICKAGQVADVPDSRSAKKMTYTGKVLSNERKCAGESCDPTKDAEQCSPTALVEDEETKKGCNDDKDKKGGKDGS
eukprot:g9241.t1